MAGSDRFELRVFGRDLGSPRDALRALAEPGEPQLSRELYLLRRGDLGHNLKARDDRLELKTLMETRGGLQRWHPQAKVGLPGAGSHHAAGREPLPAVLVEMLGPVVRPEPGVAPQLPMGLEVLAEGIRGDSARAAVHVVKRRTKLAVGDVLGEFVELALNGAALQSMALESEDPDALRATAATVGLNGAENVSYVLALHRLLGWEPLPPDSPDLAWHGG